MNTWPDTDYAAIERYTARCNFDTQRLVVPTGTS
jgi:hypothetical protein